MDPYILDFPIGPPSELVPGQRFPVVVSLRPKPQYKIIDAKTSAVVCLVADDATGVPADGLYRTDDEGQVSTGSMSASPKRALVSGAEEGGKRYFMFRDVVIDQPGSFHLHVAIHKKRSAEGISVEKVKLSPKITVYDKPSRDKLGQIQQRLRDAEGALQTLEGRSLH